MSALSKQQIRMTEAEYLAFERTSEFKHEYLDGEVFAMSGASREHNLISISTSSTLYFHLRKRPCKVFAGDMRVRIKTRSKYTYPDISVVCGEE